MLLLHSGMSENASGYSAYSTQNSHEETKPTFTDVFQFFPNLQNFQTHNFQARINANV